MRFVGHGISQGKNFIFVTDTCTRMRGAYNIVLGDLFILRFRAFKNERKRDLFGIFVSRDYRSVVVFFFVLLLWLLLFISYILYLYIAHNPAVLSLAWNRVGYYCRCFRHGKRRDGTPNTIMPICSVYYYADWQRRKVWRARVIRYNRESLIKH